MRLKYATYFNLDLDSGNAYQNNFILRGNDPFNPSNSTFGNSANYFDRYARIYNKYRVSASKVYITLVDQSAQSACYPFETGIQAKTNSNITTSPINMADQANASYKTGRHKTVWKRYNTAEKVMGDKNVRYDDEWDSDSAGSPINKWYWNINLASLAQQTQNFRCNIVVTYYCKFWSRKNFDDEVIP